MITKDKLEQNLDILRSLIPKKPLVHTEDYPHTIKEGLEKYCRQSSVNVFESNSYRLSKLNWPLPLWVNPKNIEIGINYTHQYEKFFNSWDERVKFEGFKDFDWLNVPVLANVISNYNVDQIIVDIFDINLKYIEKRLLESSLLSAKQEILLEIFKLYKSQYWHSCITNFFPIIDFAIRKLLCTNDLTKSVTTICSLFSECGFGVDSINFLMPHTALTQFVHEGSDKSEYIKKILSPEFNELQKAIEKNRFGIIGPPLSSFLLFSNSYYQNYKEDTGPINILNRHAIMHGSEGSFNTKINAVKLFSYLFLILELEPVLNILFDGSNINSSSN